MRRLTHRATTHGSRAGSKARNATKGYLARHARTRDPRPAEGAADARVPALTRARRLARRLLAGQLRLAVPDAAAPRAGRRRAGRVGRRDPGPPQDHVRGDREGREALLRTAAG